MNVRVKIRHESEEPRQGRDLCVWQDNNLSLLIDMIGSWGAVDADGEVYSRGDFSGQFVILESEAFFEIVVHPDDGS